MDSNLVFAFLILIIILLIASVIDEAILLLIAGFSIAVIAWNMDTMLSITATSYSSFGNLLILSYWISAVFCFGKAAITGYEGISIYRKKRHV